MGLIPQSFVEDLLSRLDIVDVISARVPLKKTGRNYMACCPFHNEKTPSFSVVPDKQFYNCFGCGAAGSAIKFVMTFDHVEFKDAVERLSASIGLTVVYEQQAGSNKSSKNNFSKFQQYYKILELAANYYQESLNKNILATNYLQKRNIDLDIAKNFLLGFAPNNWDNLSGNITDSVSKNTDLISITEDIYKLLEQTGLWIRKSDDINTESNQDQANNTNKYLGYDRFRNRLIFPIRDYKGKVIAFGGRVLDDSKPKYLNSPETLLFHKSAELYGLFESLDYSHKNKTKINRFIIVEGYLDVISLYQHGICTAVATLGTATSYRHLAKLFKYSSEIVFCFDGDEAGKKAAWRALENSLNSLYDGRVIKFLFLPSEHDPDSYIKQYGKPGFEELLNNSSYSITDYLFQHQESLLDDSNNLNTVEGRVSFAKLCMPLINKVPEGIYKTILKTELARICKLNQANIDKLLESDINTSFNSNFNSNLNSPANNIINSNINLVRQNNNKLGLALKSKSNLPLGYKACVLLLNYPDLINNIEDDLITDLFDELKNKSLGKSTDKSINLFKIIYLNLKKYKTIPELLDNINNIDNLNFNLDSIKSVIIKLLNHDPIVTDKEAEQEFKDLLFKINNMQKNSEMDILKAKVAEQGISSLTDIEKAKLQSLLLEKQ